VQIAIVTFEGFNEIDSLVALNILNRVKLPGWRALIACPSATHLPQVGHRPVSWSQGLNTEPRPDKGP
jgi:hypothetical protein